MISALIVASRRLTHTRTTHQTPRRPRLTHSSGWEELHKPLIQLVGGAGFEPATFWV